MRKIALLLSMVLLLLVSACLDEGPNEKLFKSVQEDSLEEVKEALQEGLDVNVKDKDGMTVLMVAAEYNEDPEIIERLLRAGADITAADQNGKSAWDYLLENEAFIKTQTYTQMTDLASDSYFRSVVQGDSLEEIRYAIFIGADVNAGEAPYTAFLWAVEQNENPEVIKLLLDSGADINAKTQSSWKVLNVAVSKNNNPEVLRMLIDAGADVNAKDKDGRTLLNYTVQHENTEKARLLIEGGADINAQNEKGNTALYDAVSKENTEIIKMLIDAGADANIQNGYYKRTPLSIAADKGYNDIAWLLIVAGADVDVQDKDGKTPLYMASSKGHTNIVRALLDAGADVNKKGWYGKALPELARDNRYKPAIIALFQSRQLINHARTGNIEAVNEYIDGVYAVSFLQDENGKTALIHASEMGHLNIVNTLIAQDAPATIKDTEGKTALDYATENGHTEIAEIIQETAAYQNWEGNWIKSDPPVPMFLTIRNAGTKRFEFAIEHSYVSTGRASIQSKYLAAAGPGGPAISQSENLAQAVSGVYRNIDSSISFELQGADTIKIEPDDSDGSGVEITGEYKRDETGQEGLKRLDQLVGMYKKYEVELSIEMTSEYQKSYEINFYQPEEPGVLLYGEVSMCSLFGKELELTIDTGYKKGSKIQIIPDEDGMTLEVGSALFDVRGTFKKQTK
jgi:uncharacterized protein